MEKRLEEVVNYSTLQKVPLPFNNHKKYHIVVEKVGEPPGSLIKWGVVKLFENQVLTIEDEDGVGEFVKKLLKRAWSIRFPSGSQVKAGY